jgi:hypothetical protein
MAVGMSTALAAFWAFWGSIENFHEGWYSRSLWENLALLIGQYLGFSIIFVILALTAIAKPKLGGLLHVLFGLSLAWAFRGTSGGMLLGPPIILLGLLYFFGEIASRRLAGWIVVGLPLLTAIGFGAGPAYNTLTRIDDGYRGARLISANGVNLIWAPSGPGWAETGVDWFGAQKACAHLSPAGDSLLDTSINIWRLPTIEEIVRSGAKHGINVGGVLNDSTMTPLYKILPDKETPLWDQHSMIIYWWTATEKDTAKAYLYAYNGQVFSQQKKFAPGYYGFRAVRTPMPHDSLLPGVVAGTKN